MLPLTYLNRLQLGRGTCFGTSFDKEDYTHYCPKEDTTLSLFHSRSSNEDKAPILWCFSQVYGCLYLWSFGRIFLRVFFTLRGLHHESPSLPVTWATQSLISFDSLIQSLFFIYCNCLLLKIILCTNPHLFTIYLAFVSLTSNQNTVCFLPPRYFFLFPYRHKDYTYKDRYIHIHLLQGHSTKKGHADSSPGVWRKNDRNISINLINFLLFSNGWDNSSFCTCRS